MSDSKEAKTKVEKAIESGKEKLSGAMSKENIEAGKEKLKAGAAEVKKRINLLPFRALAEKIPAATRAKFPILDKAIPFANQIVCGLAAVLLVTVISCSGKGGGKGKAAPASDFKYELTDDSKGIRITEFTGHYAILVIPATIEDMPVVELGRSHNGELIFMEGIRSVMEITIPASVTRIGKGEGFGSLTEITLPEGVKEIPEKAFWNCERLTTVNLPNSIETIGYGAFGICPKLTSIKLPDGIKTIGEKAFTTCQKLTSINLPKNLKEIGAEAFHGCGELNNLTIPDSLSSIKFPRETFFNNDNNAFESCGKLPLKTRARIEELGYKDKF